MNLSLDETNTAANELDETAGHVTTAFGFTISVLNITLLIALIGPVLESSANVDKRGVLVQIISVCINDSASGLAIVAIGLLRVTNDATAHACAYLLYGCMTLQAMSQGNIACICAQRFISARNLRKLSANILSRYTMALITVNIVLGIVTLFSFLVRSKFKNVNGKDLTCTLSVVVEGNIGLVMSFYYILGVIVTLVADSLCVLTIHKLRKGDSNVIGNSSSGARRDSATTTADITMRHTSITRTQKKAIFTMFLILIFFNLSVLPVFVGTITALTGSKLTANGLSNRLHFLFAFSNSLVNPVIIVTRVQEVRNRFKYAVIVIWNTLKCQHR